MITTNAEARRPRTASREVRRRQLIEATIACIARHGLSGTTMAQVTGLADLSMGLVSFHFQSKENLLQETLIHLAEEHRTRWVQSLADSALDPAAKLAAVIDAHFHPSICNEEKIPVWFAFFGETRYRDLYRDKIAQFDGERTKIVEELCQELAAIGNLVIDPHMVAQNLESLADGLWLSIMLYPRELNRLAAKQQVASYLNAVFPRHFDPWPGEWDETEPAQPCGDAI
ncbi:MAG: TetR family transcriptional regulator C-terminal domain-containing protein [Pseudomonadota bacterium]